MRQTLILLTGILFLTTVNPADAGAQDSREEYGKCGYFADALQGRPTASGEIYDKSLLTCAHNSLPFGTMVKVTRLDNKKSVTVRVNDRGPFLDGYVVDLSRKAAESIGLIRDGVTRVKVQVITKSPKVSAPVTYSATSRPAAEPVSNTTTTTVNSKPLLIKSKKQETLIPATYSSPNTVAPVAVDKPDPKPAGTSSSLYQIEVKPVPAKGFGLQVAVLTNSENLFQEITKIQSSWPGKVVVNHEDNQSLNTESFKLILGPYATRKEAEAQQRKASGKGYKKAFVVDLSE